MKIDKLLEIIKTYDHYMITTHKSCDPDGIGSELAMAYLLNHLGKSYSILNPDEVPERYLFLDPQYKLNHIKENSMQDNHKRMILVLDNSEMRRIGDINQFVEEDYSNLIVVDHHDNVENPHGIEHFFIFPDYSSTCEIVFALLQKEGLQPDYTTAIALYTGIAMDTGQFKYRKTSPRTHLAVAELLKHNFAIEPLFRKIFEDYPLAVLYLKRDILSTLEIHESIATISITSSMLENYHYTSNPVEGLINELLAPRDIRIAVSFFATQDGKVKLSFRSKGEIDVCRIAKEFSGGGHRNAAGGMVDGELETVKEKVIASLKSLLEIQERHYAV